MAVNRINVSGTLWNGPICSTCGARYLDVHRCSREDILRRLAELDRALDRIENGLDSRRQVDRTAGCPCRTENGGSGVCGCIMGGTQIICSVTS